MLVEAAVQLAEDDPGFDLDQAALGVGGEDAVEAVEAEQDAVAEGDVGERVARAGDADRVPGIPRAADRGDQLVAVTRPLDRDGPAALVARPVVPLGGHRGQPPER